MVKPSTIEKAVVNEHWVMAMHDELNQFKRNEVWELVPRPSKTKKRHLPYPQAKRKYKLIKVVLLMEVH